MSENKLKDPEWKDLKDIYLALKQGEALERITKPSAHYEGLGLGYYGPETCLALGAVDLLEDAINEIVMMGMKEEKDKEEYRLKPHFNMLHIFTETIGVGSGSIQAKRMEQGYETIGNLGQYRPGPPKWSPFGLVEDDVPTKPPKEQ